MSLDEVKIESLASQGNSVHINGADFPRLVIGLGSNCGDRRAAISGAIEWLRKILTDFRVSEIYETPPYGHVGRPYMNAVVSGRYGRNPLFNAAILASLERECKRYEYEHGRNEAARQRGDVPIDIDIVKAGEQILRPADFKRQFFRIGYLQISNC